MSDTSQGGPEILDIAIVGGGASGAYTAYRLLSPEARESPVVAALLERSGRASLDVQLFESSDRIGGRLWSVELPGMSGIPAEVGGMRFLQSQENVFGLSTRLNLNPTDFGFFNNIQYLRGFAFEFEQFADPDKVPYWLKGPEVGKNPIQIVVNAIDAALPGAVGLKGKQLIDYLRTATVDGVPLHEIGFWTLLAKRLSIEAYHLVLDASGYFTIYGNWSAYAALLEFLRNYADSSYFKLPGGYQSLPLALVEAFKAAGGRVQMGTQLRTVAPEQVGGEEVIRLDLYLPDSSATATRYARSVVLAMPQRSFELLDPTCFLFNGSPFRDDLRTVTAEPASKLFLTFDEPWWEGLDPKITTGRSDTDLPLRQCYYVGSVTSGPSAGMSLLMASYNDGTADSYWDTYLSRSAYGPNQPAPYGGRHHGSIDERLEAPHEMVMDAHRQLCELHGVQVPLPVDAVFHSWQEDPIGAGWYFWNPHVVSWEVAPRIRQPQPGHRVFTCGSCYSENQGWVEGALNTAEMMLEEHFGMGRPPWVSPDYYMGP